MLESFLLEQFLAFADCGTLSAAAEKLHTSQPALSRSMKKLEQELGVALFIRRKNQLQLNETGQYALLYARELLRANEEFTHRVQLYDRSLRTINIGYGTPVPQMVLTPLINSLFGGMRLSADMKDDRDFLKRLSDHTYQLVVTHKASPDSGAFLAKKCGHEDLFLSLPPGHPLAFSPEIHLKDLDGLNILLLYQIGFWAAMTKDKTPHTHYLLQVQREAFQELARNSGYPSFSSSYYLNRGEKLPGQINIPIADPECHVDYYLVCLKKDQHRFEPLFAEVNEKTVW